MNKQMMETTRATQARFVPENLLSGALLHGNHPISAPGGLLNRVWYLYSEIQQGRVNIERVREITFQTPQIRQIVEQYIDLATGLPKPEMADSTNSNVVEMRNETACFGRSCGFGAGCFKQCSLGPSHTLSGEPLGVVGDAPIHSPDGKQAQGVATGVLKVDEDGNVKKPERHRDNSCLTLSLFLRAIGVPPAPTAPLADALWDALTPTLGAIERGLAAQPHPTPQTSPAQPAPPPAAPPQTSPAQPAPPPAAPPQTSPAQPPAQPPAQAPTAPPQMAPPPAQAPVASAPPQMPPAQPPAAHGLAPIFVGLTLSYDAQCELHALQYALEHAKEKPKSLESIKNMEQRHVKAKYSENKLLATWRGAAEDRNLMTGTGKAARLKSEFWPQHVPLPVNYYEVKQEEEEQAAPQQVALQPGAPAQPAGPRISAVEQAAGAAVPPPSPAPAQSPATAAPSNSSGSISLDTSSKEVLREHTEAMNNLAAALRTFRSPEVGHAGNAGRSGAPTGNTGGQPVAPVQQPAATATGIHTSAPVPNGSGHPGGNSAPPAPAAAPPNYGGYPAVAAPPTSPPGPTAPDAAAPPIAPGHGGFNPYGSSVQHGAPIVQPVTR